MPKLDPAILLIYNSIKNKEAIHKQLASDLHHAVEENFRTEGARLGERWPPLSKQYAKQKAKDPKAANKLLQRYGSLRRSILERSNQQYAAVYTNDIRAGALFFGATIQIYPRSETFLRTKNKLGRFKKLPKDLGKRKLGRGFTFRAYTINIPPRNPFKVNEDDYKTFENTIYKAIGG